MAVRKHSDGKWMFDLTLKIDGRKKRVRKYGYDTKGQAKESENNYIRTYDTPTEQKLITVEDAMHEYLDHIKFKTAITTQTLYKQCIDMHIVPYFKKVYMNDLTIKSISNWHNKLFSSGKTEHLVNRVTSVFMSSFKLCKDLYDLTNDPFKRNIKYREKRREFDFYTPQEFKQYITKMNDFKHYCFSNFSFYCGTRVGETNSLQWKDIDFKNKTANINKSVTFAVKGQSYKIMPPKNNSSNRKVSLNNNIVNMLVELKKYYMKQKGFNEEYFVFGGDKPITYTCLRRYNDNTAKKADIKRIRLHDFRHSHATLLLSNNYTIKLVADRLGHIDPNITLKTYAHVMPDEIEKALDFLDEV